MELTWCMPIDISYYSGTVNQTRRNFPLCINQFVSRNSIWFVGFFNRSKLAQFHLVHLDTRLMNGLTTFKYFYTLTHKVQHMSVCLYLCVYSYESRLRSRIQIRIRLPKPPALRDANLRQTSNRRHLPWRGDTFDIGPMTFLKLTSTERERENEREREAREEGEDGDCFGSGLLK